MKVEAEEDSDPGDRNLSGRRKEIRVSVWEEGCHLGGGSRFDSGLSRVVVFVNAPNQPLQSPFLNLSPILPPLDSIRRLREQRDGKIQITKKKVFGVFIKPI